jgi:hypothetical protein
MSAKVEEVLNQEEYMKKKLGMLIAMFALLNSSALADSFGVRFGFPNLGVQYTSGESFRISGYIYPFYGLGIGVQGDLILGSIKGLGNTDALNLYYGAGANAGYYTFSSGNIYSYSYLNVGVQGTGWLEYTLSPTLSAFVDASFGIDYGIALGGTGILTGINYGGITPYYGGAFGLNFKL